MQYTIYALCYNNMLQNICALFCSVVLFLLREKEKNGLFLFSSTTQHTTGKKRIEKAKYFVHTLVSWLQIRLKMWYHGCHRIRCRQCNRLALVILHQCKWPPFLSFSRIRHILPTTTDVYNMFYRMHV